MAWKQEICNPFFYLIFVPAVSANQLSLYDMCFKEQFMQIAQQLLIIQLVSFRLRFTYRREP